LRSWRVAKATEIPGSWQSTRFERVRLRLEAFEPDAGWQSGLYEFLLFGFKQGWACLFGGLMLALLLTTHLIYPENAALARYDFLTLAALLIQLGMLWFRLESWDEAKVILIFHIVGTIMEIFKTAQGSWIYPEESFLRIGGVPLFSGFMYAAVGSYIARVWRIFDFKFSAYPNSHHTIVLAIAIYINFFTHHWLPDIRLLLFAAMGLLFLRTRVGFRVWKEYRWMPLIVGLTLVAIFIWLAENVGTFARAWSYPSQNGGWHIVSPAKMGAWLLLMYISFVLVALVNKPAPLAPHKI
jgi:uncharacterized membrane protein YoaT (DUF817 family)